MGEAEFLARKFVVNNSTMIPRMATETIVNTVVTILNSEMKGRNNFVKLSALHAIT